jgi:hypothetical protein
MLLCQTTNTLRDIAVSRQKKRILVVWSNPGPKNPLLRTYLLAASTGTYTTFFLHP